jgi:hypothetical protein
MASLGPDVDASSANVDALPSVSPVVEFVHEYTAAVSVPSLRSVPVAEHVKVSVMLGDDGLTDTALIVGSVFSMVAVDMVESLPPYPSLTDAVQVMVSPTPASDFVSVKEAELPNMVAPFVHS